jgi:hypothetical protein
MILKMRHKLKIQNLRTLQKKLSPKNWKASPPKLLSPINTPALIRLILISGGVLILAACNRTSTLEQSDYFIAPSLDAQASPLVLETSTSLPASPTPPCENHMVFLLDVSVPDGSVFTPGAPIEKIWRVRNEGSCTWSRGYTIQIEDGPPLGGITEHVIPSTAPGDIAEITANFTAPNEAGNYRSSWRAHDIGDNSFGVLIYIEIVVSED